MPSRLQTMLRRAVSRIRHALPKSLDESVDSVRVRMAEQDPYTYTSEIARQIQVHYDTEFHMLRMSPTQLESCKLSYDPQSALLIKQDDSIASTAALSSKGQSGFQAFVLSKNNELYAATHNNVGNTTDVFTHASFLGGRPAEMAGLIKIESGKIIEITDNSGHYAPTSLDMYRGIKALQNKMPGAFEDNATITLYGQKARKISEFMQCMENPPEYPLHQRLRDERAQYEIEILDFLKSRQQYGAPIEWSINTGILDIASVVAKYDDETIKRMSRLFETDNYGAVLCNGDIVIGPEIFINAIVTLQNHEAILNTAKAIALSQDSESIKLLESEMNNANCTRELINEVTKIIQDSTDKGTAVQYATAQKTKDRKVSTILSPRVIPSKKSNNTLIR